MAEIRTTNVTRAHLVDELLGNRAIGGEDETVRIPVASLARQMAAARGPDHSTRALLDADLGWPADVRGYVWGDANTALRGVYAKVGASGTGSWTRLGPLPGGDTSEIEARLAELGPEQHPGKRGTIAAAPTMDVGAVDADYVVVTGTATIASLGTAGAGIERTLQFDAGASVLVHSAALSLIGGGDISIEAGDIGVFRSGGSPGWRMTGFQRRSGRALASGEADLSARIDRLAIAPPGRPGEPGARYSREWWGEAASRSALTIGEPAVSARHGSVWRIEGADVAAAGAAYVDVAPRIDWPVEAGRVYRTRWLVERITDPVDPLGDAAETWLPWLGADKATLAAPAGTPTRVGGARVLTVAAGALLVEVTFGRSVPAGATVDVTAPDAARYVSPMLRLYGTTHVTDVVVVGDPEDITDALLGGADVASLTTRMAAAEAGITAIPAINAGLLAGKQAASPHLTRLASLASGSAKFVPYWDGAQYWPTAFPDWGRTLVGLDAAAQARTHLGAGNTGNSVFVAGTEAAALTALGGSAVGQSVFRASDAATARSALGASSIGDAIFRAADAAAIRSAIDAPQAGSVQPVSASLTSLASLSLSAGYLAYPTGAGTWGLTPLTSAGRDLIGAATAAAQRGLLGMSTVGQAVAMAVDQSAARAAIGAQAASTVLSGIAGATYGTSLTAIAGMVAAGSTRFLPAFLGDAGGWSEVTVTPLAVTLFNQSTQAQMRSAIGAAAAGGSAAAGANADITSLSGLTTALSVAQGGTGATTAPAARTALGLGSIATQDAGAVTVTGATGTLTVQGTTTFGGIAVANRYATISNWGRLTVRFDDNGFVRPMEAQNFGISGAGQGVEISATFGTGGVSGGTAMLIRGETTGDWASAGTRSAALVAYLAQAGSVIERFRVRPDGALLLSGQTVINAARHPELRFYTVATAPLATPAGQLIYISNGTGGKCLAVSDGSGWRWPDGTVIS